MTPAALTRFVLKAYVSDRLPDTKITATAGLADEITAVTASLARKIELDEKLRLDKRRGFPLPVKHPVMRGKWVV